MEGRQGTHVVTGVCESCDMFDENCDMCAEGPQGTHVTAVCETCGMCAESLDVPRTLKGL
jgi:hypothetical protein